MICYEKEKEVKALNSTYLIFSDKTDTFDSEATTYFDQGFEATLDDLSYSLYSYDSLNKSMEGLYFYDPAENKNGVRKYLLSICEPDKPKTCKFIPIEHSSPTAQDEAGNVIADLGANEIYILFDGKIYFAYGDETRKFDLLASDWNYSVSGYAKNNEYMYVLYECGREYYRECNYIPFSYATPERKDVKLDIDCLGKLSVYIGDKLIFTYKEFFCEHQEGCTESQCLSASCTTPGQ